MAMRAKIWAWEWEQPILAINLEEIWLFENW